MGRLSILLSSTLALAVPATALAHENDVHIGGIPADIPPVALWISGAVLGLIFLMFFVGWAVSYRGRRLRGLNQANDTGSVNIREGYDGND